MQRHLGIIAVTVMLIGWLSPIRQAAAADGAIIVHSAVAVSDIAESKIKRIYLGRAKMWESNVKIRPVYLSAQQEVGKKFFAEVINMSPRSFQKIWIKRTFSGDGAAPQSFDTARQVLDYVAATPGAIGMVPLSAIEGAKGVKVITLDKKPSF